MISVPKSSLHCVALAVLFSIFSVADGHAKTGQSAAPPRGAAESPEQSDAAGDLADQVSEISHSAAISRAKKEKRISTAVRVAVVAATAYKQKPEEVLGVALDLTEAATRAAPGFAEVIANAVSFTPALARIDNAAGQIRSAAYAAAKRPNSPRQTRVAAAKSRTPAKPLADAPEAPATRHRSRTASNPEPETEAPLREYAADSVMSDGESMAHKSSLGGNTTFNVTANLSVSHDDNIYLSSANEVSDTVYAFIPGVAFSFGQNSLAHGSLSYSTAFTRYADKTSPNVNLGNGAAAFGYDSGSLAVNGTASFQQLNQNNNEVAALGQKAIFRRDVLGLNASVESHLTAKTSVMTGANYSKSEYKTAGLTGSQETEVPLKVFYETSPKVSVSTGVSYRRVNPQNGGAKGKDMDYNLGARGNFTAKLSGTLSVDYRTRTVGSNPRENLWGLNGSLNYELTPKTTSTLGISNDFSTGALGESLKNSSYDLQLSTDLTPQWQLGATLAYRRVEYGPSVFSLNNVTTPVDRRDKHWEGGLQATYLFRSWLSATADYTLRRNHSTLTGAEYTDSILSLMLGWRY